MDTLEQIKKNQVKWEAEVNTRKERMQFINEQLPALVSAAVQSSGTAQKEAQSKRTQYAAELETLKAEMPEVQRRYNEAKQEEKDFCIEEAEREYKAVLEKFIPAKSSLNELTLKNSRLETWTGLRKDAETIEETRLFRIEYANARALFDTLAIEENKARKNLQRVRERAQ